MPRNLLHPLHMSGCIKAHKSKLKKTGNGKARRCVGQHSLQGGVLNIKCESSHCGVHSSNYNKGSSETNLIIRLTSYLNCSVILKKKTQSFKSTGSPSRYKKILTNQP